VEFPRNQGWIQSLERGGVHFVEKVEDKKKWRNRMSEGSSNITMKLKYIVIIPIYSFTDKLRIHCLRNTATALLELLTDCSIKKKRRSRLSEGSSNITMKLNYIIIVPIYSFTRIHCLINTATALLELLTDCSIRVFRSFITKDRFGGGGGITCPLHPPGSAPGNINFMDNDP